MKHQRTGLSSNRFGKVCLFCLRKFHQRLLSKTTFLIQTFSVSSILVANECCMKVASIEIRSTTKEFGKPRVFESSNKIGLYMLSS